MEITHQSIDAFLETIEEKRKKDIHTLIELFKRLTGKEPKLWGTIIGFGSLHYKYKSGREGDMPLIGLASRKEAITLYLTYTIDKFPQIKKLGKYKTGVGCLYIKKLEDIDLTVLESLTVDAIKDTMKISFIKDNESK